MDSLLAETLGDFGCPDDRLNASITIDKGAIAAAPSAAQQEGISSTSPCKPPSASSSHNLAHNPKLPPRKPAKQPQPQSSPSPSTSSTTQAVSSSSPLSSSSSSSAAAMQLPHEHAEHHIAATTPLPALPLNAQGKSKMMESMPPDAKELAAQLMMLMQESGILDEQAGNNTSSSSTLLPQSAPPPPPPPSSSATTISAPPGKPSEFKFKSPALAGLAQQTKATVASQSKYSAGESTPSSSSGAAFGVSGGKGGGNDLFGGLGSLLSSLGSGSAASSTSSSSDAYRGGSGGGAGGMNMMVDFILKNLLSKEVLYGPLIEIRDKYPAWIQHQKKLRHVDEGGDAGGGGDAAGGGERRGGGGTKTGDVPLVSVEELSRYELQHQAIIRVCTQYEDDPNDFAKIMELIQGMQMYGDPPPEIVSDMTQGLPEGLSSSFSASSMAPAPRNEGQGDADGSLEDFDLKSLLGADFDSKEKCPIQ